MLSLSVNWTKDSNNSIGGGQNFVYRGFILEANVLQNVYTATLFVGVGAKNY
jgi:hypothetical protein